MLFVQNSVYPLAREKNKRGGFGDNSKPGTSGLTDPEKKVRLGWPHLQEACQQHHQAGSYLESTGEEVKKTQEHIVHRHFGRNAEKCSLLEGTGEDSGESGVLAEFC